MPVNNTAVDCKCPKANSFNNQVQYFNVEFDLVNQILINNPSKSYGRRGRFCVIKDNWSWCVAGAVT